MSTRRENLLLRGGLLIGFGAGLSAGTLLLFTAVAYIFLHNIFITGIQWVRLLVFPIVPLVTFAAGGWLLWRARRVEV